MQDIFPANQTQLIMRCLTTQTARSGAMFKQSTRFINSFLPLLFTTAVATIPYTKLKAQAMVNSVTFTQYDRYGTDGRMIFQNSSLGQFSFSAVPDKKTMYYLNVFTKTTTGREAWVVQNLPVSPDIAATPIACQSVYVDYKLMEVQPGNLVNEVAYSVNVSPVLYRTKSPVPVAVVRTGNAAVDAELSRSVFASANAAFAAPAPVPQPYTVAPVIRGALLHELSADYSETANVALYANNAPIAVPVAKDRDIPGDVEEDPNGCVPGAFARSIAWLSGKYNFKAARKPQDIYDTLKKRMDTCTMPASNPCKIKVKSDYLKEITGGRGSTRRIMPVTSPADTIKKYPDCDIEVDIQQLPGEDLGHFIVVVSIECGNDGCCTIKYRDDSLQGKPGGDKCVKTAKICGDSITTDKKRKIRSLVIECVTPATQKQAEIPVTDIVSLLPNIPNPFGSTTMLRVEVKETGNFHNARLKISNDRGAELQLIKLDLHKGINEITYQAQQGIKGLLYCTLEVDGKVIGTQKMFVRQ
jgi:hypothetical protein